MTSNIKKLTKCRISGSSNLIKVLSLGKQALTGVFPNSRDLEVTVGELDLVFCTDSGLLQLGHSFDLNEMYGDNYGYRSGLNTSMVKHLHNKAIQLQSIASLEENDLIVDIGCNDGTFLNSFNKSGLFKVGIDPTAEKFKKFISPDINLVCDFFSATSFNNNFPGNKKAKLITSISMFYDLEDPNKFVSDIKSILDENGIWHFEQSYMPTMLRMNSYDTICHEHLEYYSLSVVKDILERNNLKILDVATNSINGGSFYVNAAHADSAYESNEAIINWLLDQEKRLDLNSIEPYLKFYDRIDRHKKDLVSLIRNLNNAGKSVVGYGASTKGNVLLQFCEFTENDLKCIAEINEDKFYCFTPGTLIPILPLNVVHKMQPDYMLVLPWHFKDSIIAREEEFLKRGGKLIFPLPEIEII
jgi:hypothetical protein